MGGEKNVTGRLAEWAAGLQFDSIPKQVLWESKSQILSVIASVHAGHFSDAGRTFSRTVREWASGKEATLIPSGERTSVHNAIFGNAALSMALDYDDYLFNAHTGHSAVLCTLALAEKHSVSGKNFLAAQTIANEIGGRLAAAIPRGPLDAPISPFVHLVGGALVGARILELDQNHTASAIGLALSQPNHGLWAGFVGAEAKLLLASQTAPVGVMAAELASAGLRGPVDVLEHEQGFLRTFSQRPLPGAFEGLGKTWLSDTLSYKIYPGCVYIDTTVDCILHLVRSHSIDPKKVRAIHVATNPMTLEMEEKAAPCLMGPDSLPAALNYSVAYNAAAALMEKELTPRQFLRERIKDPAVWQLASKVHLTLDEDMAHRARSNSLVKMTMTPEGEQPHLDLGSIDLNSYKVSCGAKVKIEMEDGRTFEAEEEVPRGAAGRPTEERRQSVEDKFRRETRYTLRKEKMERAIDLIEHLETATASQVREIVRLCCSERT